MAYDASEQDVVIQIFTKLLRIATGDGGKKRASGEKPPWYNDGEHEDAMYRHIGAWQRGEQVDPDNGGHPLIGAAWRALAIAAIEMGETP